MSTSANPQIPQTSTPDTRRRQAPISGLTRHLEPSTTSALAAYRRVEWVRVSDLAQRTGTRLIQQGAQSHQQLRQMLAAARRDGADYVRTALRERRTQIEADHTGNTSGDGHARRRERLGR